MESSRLPHNDWNLLIERIDDGLCTPFLGAGVAAGLLPLGGQVANELATKFDYPFENSSDLIKVSQYVAIKYDSIYAKQRLVERLRGVKLPEHDAEPNEPHRLLAKLPLPLYITTNYDDLMIQALKERRKDPVYDICRWNENIPELRSHSRRSDPTVANPLVFYLHGCTQSIDSMVLTEDDYLDFLTNRTDLLPPAISMALRRNSLLFIGYQLADWNFRVILRSLRRWGIKSYAVMPAAGDVSDVKKRGQSYLDQYYGRLQIKVYWGTASEFLSELFERAKGRFD